MSNEHDKNGKINIHEALEFTDNTPDEVIALRDILNRRELAKRILFRLMDESCSRSLGVYGGWGTGKTSLLNLMKELNKRVLPGGTSPIYMVSIDAWEHEASEGLLIPIVAALDDLKGTDVKISELMVVVKRALFASGMVFAGAMLKKYTDVELNELQDGVSGAVLHDGSAHKTILDKWKTQLKEVKATKDAFAALVDSACRKQGVNKLAICVDNLDRCSPENVVRLLESVKVFFNVPGCVWVFAVDSEVIASYIDHKYAGTKMDGNSYLDKIIPEQYHLSLSPTIDRERIINLLCFAADTKRLELNEKNIPQLPRVLVPRRLIKTAAKLSEFYKLRNRDAAKISKPLAFNLILLYHVWPAFYQRFSSDAETHIRGVLDSFFPVENAAPGKETSVKPGGSIALPLLKEYIEDQDLSYFIKIAFSEYPRARSPFVTQLIDGMSGLREIGLP
jgi:hypothetical protein